MLSGSGGESGPRIPFAPAVNPRERLRFLGRHRYLAMVFGPTRDSERVGSAKIGSAYPVAPIFRHLLWLWSSRDHGSFCDPHLYSCYCCLFGLSCLLASLRCSARSAHHRGSPETAWVLAPEERLLGRGIRRCGRLCILPCLDCHFAAWHSYGRYGHACQALAGVAFPRPLAFQPGLCSLRDKYRRRGERLLRYPRSGLSKVNAVVGVRFRAGWSDLSL